MYNVVERKLTFAISCPDKFLLGVVTRKYTKYSLAYGMVSVSQAEQHHGCSSTYDLHY